jgi:hypothetical protein
VNANVIEVTGSFGDDQTVWMFDQPVTILSGATWSMFTIREDGGPVVRTGASAVQLSPTTIRIAMDLPPEDFGNGWFWELTSVPAKVKTVEGGNVLAGGGDLTLI